jgi:hypothetical protein
VIDDAVVGAPLAGVSTQSQEVGMGDRAAAIEAEACETDAWTVIDQTLTELDPGDRGGTAQF